MKKYRMIGMIGLVLALLLAAMPVYADPVPGEGNTDVVVVNTNQNTGAAAAEVTAIYYDTSGTAENPRTRNINPRGSYTFLAADAGLGDNWSGSMVLQSDNELAAVAEITWSNGGAGDGTTAGAYLGYAEGAEEMYLPFVVRASNQFTRISVQNTEDSTTTFSMKYINRDGGTDFTITDSLPSLGSKTYDVHMPGGQVPNLANTSYWSANGFWGGAVKITTQGSKKIAAVATNHWNLWAVAYNGASTGATRNYIPSVERRDSTAQGLGWRGFSVIIVQCAETSGNCAVAIDYVNAQTGATDLTVTKTIGAGAALGANTRAGIDNQNPEIFENALGDTWVGSAIARTTNSTDISVIAYSIRPGTNLAGATSAANVGEAGNETFLPGIYQKNTAGVSCPPNPDQDWTQYSLIRIQNPTNNNASDLDIYFFNTDGSMAYQDLNNSLQAGKSTNRNTRVDCSTISLGGSWNGSVYVSADQPLVAVAETLWGGVKMNSYNGYSVTR